MPTHLKNLWGLAVALAALPCAAETASPSRPGAEAPATRPADEPKQPDDPMGLGAALRRLGRETPVGRDVVMGHVEGGPRKYLPDWRNKKFGKVIFVRRSGLSDVFGHATTTAREVYGPGAVAPGVRVVHCFSSGHWLTDGFLKAGSADPPADDLPRVYTHSWIGDPPAPEAEHILARVDYAVDRRDVIVVAGVNNGRGSRVPALLGSGHNVIAVGVASGKSSGGFTRVAGEGRTKPDIVAPRGLTSYSTPVVAGIAARLLEAARSVSEQDAADAAQPEMIKAVMLAGATKPDGWSPAPGKPLDEHLGAGVVHFDNSLRIYEAGRAAPGEASFAGGWDLRPLGGDEKAVYPFEAADPIRDVSIVATWNRRVDDAVAVDEAQNRVWVGQPRVTDVDLRLWRRTDDGGVEAVGASLGSVDNVEHIYRKALPAGSYIMEVRRQPLGGDEPWPVAVAWRSSSAD